MTNDEAKQAVREFRDDMVVMWARIAPTLDSDRISAAVDLSLELYDRAVLKLGGIDDTGE